MVRTKDLSYTHPGGSPITFPDLSCDNNGHLLILGKSGSGKTTLLHLLAGILQPQQGVVEVGRKDIHQLSSKELDLFRGQNIGIIFQKPHFVKSLSVIENIMLAQKLAGRSVNKEAAQKLLKRLQVEGKDNKKVYQLSLGEQQRVSIARALINEPDIILADEPTSSLDDENCRKVVGLLNEMAQEHNSGLIIVTHDNRLKQEFDNKVEL